jgi:WD40 repeat protein
MSNTGNQINTNQNDKYFTLQKIVGLGCKDSYSISSNKKNGLTAWVTGPYAVLYDIKKDKQIKFLKNKNNKIFNCLTFNEEGNILACGEGNCRNSEIILFELNNLQASSTEEISFSLKTNLKGHKFGIEKLKFFRGDKFLISIGDKEDKSIFIYSLQNNEIVFSSKYNRPVLCFDICDNFILLGGVQFMKLWNIEDSEGTGKKLQVIKNNVDLGKLKDKNFTSCILHHPTINGSNLGISSNSPTNRALLLTSDGHLAEMKTSTRTISRWVHLKTEKGISMCIYDQMLVCGCGDGIIRIFKAESLEHVVTLHRPPPLGRANIDANIKKINISVTQDEKFADVVTLNYNNFHEKLLSIYSDKTFFVWDLKKSDKIYVDRYNAFHSGSINNMDIQETKDNILRVVTCSDDKTVKFWNFKMEDFPGGLKSDQLSQVSGNPLPRKISHIAYSKIIRRIFYYGKNFNHFKFDMEGFINGEMGKKDDIMQSNPSQEGEDSNNNILNVEITSLKFSSDEKYLIAGDNQGNIYIYNLVSFEQVNFASAHNAQISSIDILTNEKGQYLLATGSVDNLINIIDMGTSVDQDFESYDRSVLSDHMAPVTDVQFIVDKLKQTKLVSCSADRSINFYLVNNANNVQLVQRFQEDDISTYCLAKNPHNNQIIAGHNGRVTIWKTKLCVIDKIFKMKKGENLLDNFRIAVDKTGTIMAISNNDKYIRIRWTADGQLITKIPIAESISAMFFALNNSYLIASSVEGYFYFFKIDTDNLVLKPPTPNPEKQKMKNKLKMLQKFMQDDVNFSKNERVKALIDKMKNSEDVKLEDLKMLESHFMDKKIQAEDGNLNNLNNLDNKNFVIPQENQVQLQECENKQLIPVPNNEKLNQNDLDNDNAEELIKFVNKINSDFLKNKNQTDDNSQNLKPGSSEEIEIKEEKNTNEDEEEKPEAHSNYPLNRSTIFEKNLKEISPDAMKKSIICNTRVSLTDTYYKKKLSGDVKHELNSGSQIMHIPKNPVVESIFKKANPIPLPEKLNKLNNYNNLILSKQPQEKKSEKEEMKILEPPKEKDSEPKEPIHSIPSINPLPNSEIKNNNFFAKKEKENLIINQQSEKEISTTPKVLVPHNSKKILSKDNQTHPKSNNDINELQQLISDTNKYVDNVENRVNSSSDLNNNSFKNNIPNQNKENKNSTIEDDYDYFTKEDRLSYIKGVDLNNIPKANNIFKKNLTEDIAKPEQILINNKFNMSNINTNQPSVHEEKRDKVTIDETIVEDIQDIQSLNEKKNGISNHQHIEHTENAVNITQMTNMTKFEVSDSFVNRDKIYINEIQAQNTLIYSQSNPGNLLNTQTFLNESNSVLNTQSNMNNFTQLLNTTNMTTEGPLSTIDSKPQFENNKRKYVHGENIIQNLQSSFINGKPVSSISSLQSKKKIQDCITEKFCFSLLKPLKTTSTGNLQSLREALDNFNKDENLNEKNPQEMWEFLK